MSNGNVAIDKVSLLKSIYDDHKLRDLSVIINELNDNQLLTDNLFSSLQFLGLDNSCLIMTDHYNSATL